MNAKQYVEKLAKWGATPPSVRLNVTRRTAMKFAKPECRGGRLIFKGIEVVPLRKSLVEQRKEARSAVQ